MLACTQEKYRIICTITSHILSTNIGHGVQNDAPTGEAYTSQNQSVAAYIAGDKAAFYHCGFFSTHNTLFDSKGRHYFDACYIQGSIDFIFGRARSLYHVSIAYTLLGFLKKIQQKRLCLRTISTKNYTLIVGNL